MVITCFDSRCCFCHFFHSSASYLMGTLAKSAAKSSLRQLVFVLCGADAGSVLFSQYGLYLERKLPVAAFEDGAILVRMDMGTKISYQIFCLDRLTELPKLLAVSRQGQGGRILHAFHCASEPTPVQMLRVKLKQPGKLLFEASQTAWLEFSAFLGDKLADVRRDDELRMLLRRKGWETICGFEVLVPVLMFRLKDRDTTVSMAPQDLGKPSIGLNARLIVVETEEDVLDTGVLFQHPEHGVFAGAAEGGVAVGLPALLI